MNRNLWFCIKILTQTKCCFVNVLRSIVAQYVALPMCDYSNCKCLQVADFVGSNDDSGEASGIFHDGHGVDFLEPFVNHASPAHIGEPCQTNETSDRKQTRIVFLKTLWIDNNFVDKITVTGYRFNDINLSYWLY